MFYYFLSTAVVLFICLKLKVKLYHPLVVTFLIWLIIPAAYVIFPSGLYALSEKVYPVVFSYIFSFLFGVIFYYIAFGKCKNKTSDSVYPKNKNKIIFYFVFFLTFYLFLRYLILVLHGNTLYRLIVQGNLPLDLKYLFYLDKLSLAYFFYLICQKKISRKEKVFAVLFFLTYMLKFSKMDVMQLFVGALLSLWIGKKIKLRQIIFLGAIMFVLISLIHILRVDSVNSLSVLFESIGKMLSIYILSPLKAFDMLINEEISMPEARTFVFLANVLRKLFGINLISTSQNFDGWVYVPYPTNVYTCMYTFYSDFKMCGTIIFGNLLGFFWSYVYEKRYKAFFYVMYTALFYILAFQFFSEILFSYFSGCLQTVFFCLLVVRLKESKKLYKNLHLLFKVG